MKEDTRLKEIRQMDNKTLLSEFYALQEKVRYSNSPTKTQVLKFTLIEQEKMERDL